MFFGLLLILLPIVYLLYVTWVEVDEIGFWTAIIGLAAIFTCMALIVYGFHLLTIS